MKKRTVKIPESKILSKLLAYKKEAIKILLMSENEIIHTKIFSDQRSAAAYLQKRNLSNNICFILIASSILLEIKNPGGFLDEQLIDILMLVNQDKEALPHEAHLTVRNGNGFRSRSCPFFLLPENISVYADCSPSAAILVVPEKIGKFSLKEDMKLIRNAGLSLHSSIIIRKNLSSRRDVENFVKNNSSQLSSVSTIIFSMESKPSILTCLERKSGCAVLTRDELIVSIFEKRAVSRSGKLKIASAVVKKEKTLFRHKVKGLSRIRGGVGLKGPGETKESERKRIFRKRESEIKKALEKEHLMLESRHKHRKRIKYPIVCLVGYTNAGKSTLFNSLLNRNASNESEKLFSSIDPLIRQHSIFGKKLFLVDTVGLIEGMNEATLETFSPTFREISDASLILHLIDPTDINWKNKKVSVEKTLRDFSIDLSKRVVLFSKKDLLEKPPESPSIFYSAHSREDILEIKKLIHENIS
ncbi:MAG: GTPase [bacterium]